MKWKFVRKQSYQDFLSSLSLLQAAAAAGGSGGGGGGLTVQTLTQEPAIEDRDLSGKDAKVEAVGAGYSFTASFKRAHSLP